MIYKIAVCDDSAADRDYIAELVQQWAAEEKHTVQLSAFPSAESFLFCYAEKKDYDILLLDIEMGDMDGVSLAKKLRLENSTVQIVFITGFPDFIAEGYEVSALHYLIKPVSAEKLAAVLDKAAANLHKTDKSVIFTVDGEAVRMALRDIIYAESFAHSCMINTTAGSFEIRMSISDTEKLLGEGFIRTHRSYLVGLSSIRRISKTDVTLDNGTRIPLSRGNYQTVNQSFIRYFRGE